MFWILDNYPVIRHFLLYTVSGRQRWATVKLKITTVMVMGNCINFTMVSVFGTFLQKYRSNGMVILLKIKISL